MTNKTTGDNRHQSTRQCLSFFLLSIIAALLNAAIAAESTGPVRVRTLGSFSDGNTINVYTSDLLDKKNPAGCGKTDFYAFLIDGKQIIYDLIKSSVIAGREVSLGISSGTCSSNDRPLIISANISTETSRAGPVAARGVGGGKVTQIRAHANDIFYFTTESYSGGPTCNTSLHWAVSLNTEAGRAMHSNIMTAFATGESVAVAGSGMCDVISTRESVLSVTVTQ